MTLKEVEDVVRSRRWSPIRRMRKDHAYIYAARKVAGQRKERYIAPLTSLEALTVETLMAKLTDFVAASNVDEQYLVN